MYGVRFMHLAMAAAQELSSLSQSLRRIQSLYMHISGFVDCSHVVDFFKSTTLARRSQRTSCHSLRR